VSGDAWEAADRLLEALVGPGQSGTTHRVAHDFLVEFARNVIGSIADISEALGEQAGVGGMETAGQIVSYLAEHPTQLEPLLKHGVFELPADWIERGRLTWHAADGRVVNPEYARRARIISKLKKGIEA
jgi:hypothetical protein